VGKQDRDFGKSVEQVLWSMNLITWPSGPPFRRMKDEKSNTDQRIDFINLLPE
jgi:hypothetical protein